MVEVDAVGQKQIETLCESADSGEWNGWELEFIESLNGRKYQNLSVKQKAIITRLHDKLEGR